MNRPQLDAAFADHQQRLAAHNSATDEIVRRKEMLNARGHELTSEAFAAETAYLAQAGEHSDYTARALIAERAALDAERATIEQREKMAQYGKTAAAVAGKGALFAGAGAVAGGMALWESKLLTKVGIVTAALAGATWFVSGSNPPLAGTLGTFAVGGAVLWALIAIFGNNHKGGARPSAAPAMQATTVQDQALAAAQEREQQAAAEADRIRADAEARRASAIARAKQQTTTDSDWD